MSREMMAVFFPTSDALSTRYLPSLYDRILPIDCAAAEWPFPWSTLFPLCVFGIGIGLWGVSKLHQPSYLRGFNCWWWMNLSAAFCHCFTPLRHFYKPMMVGCDVGFTCATSICLCLGALSSGEQDGSKLKLYDNLSVWMPGAALIVAVLGNSMGPLHAVTGLRS